METFKIKITKAKVKTYWYATRIGVVYEVVGVSNAYNLGDSFLVKVGNDVETFLVLWEDCTLFFED